MILLAALLCNYRRGKCLIHIGTEGFFSDVFDLSYEFWGDPGGADEIVERGDLSKPSFSVWWLRQEQLMACFAMRRPDEERDAAQRWIAAKQRVSAAKLKSSSSVAGAAI
jgi:Reductase C-terminal